MSNAAAAAAVEARLAAISSEAASHAIGAPLPASTEAVGIDPPSTPSNTGIVAPRKYTLPPLVASMSTKERKKAEKERERLKPLMIKDREEREAAAGGFLVAQRKAHRIDELYQGYEDFDSHLRYIGCNSEEPGIGGELFLSRAFVEGVLQFENDFAAFRRDMKGIYALESDKLWRSARISLTGIPTIELGVKPKDRRKEGLTVAQCIEQGIHPRLLEAARALQSAYPFMRIDFSNVRFAWDATQRPLPRHWLRVWELRDKLRVRAGIPKPKPPAPKRVAVKSAPSLEQEFRVCHPTAKTDTRYHDDRWVNDGTPIGVTVDPKAQTLTVEFPEREQAADVWAVGDVHTMYVGSERWKYDSFTRDCEATVTKITAKMVSLQYRGGSGKTVLSTREFLDRVYAIAETTKEEDTRKRDRAAQSWLTNFRVTTAGELKRVLKAIEKDKTKLPGLLPALLDVPAHILVPEKLFDVLNAAHDATNDKVTQARIAEAIAALSKPSEERIAASQEEATDTAVFTDGPLGKRQRA